MSHQDKNFLDYSHNRKNHFKEVNDDIFRLVNRFGDHENLIPLLNYFERKYQLPRAVVKQKIKQHLSRSYFFKKGKFKSRLRIRNMAKYFFAYGVLIYALIFSKTKKKIKKYILVIDNIESSHELLRFEKLINLVGPNKVLVVTKDIDLSREFPNYHFYNNKLFKNLSLLDLTKTIFNELFIGVWLAIKVSIRTKVNLLPISLQIIHSYLTFKSLFEENKADFLLQERHYDTNSIKNYIFKSYCGGLSCTIQKNIIQSDPTYFFVDIDYFLSYGKEGSKRLFDYGGRIEKVEPIGSMFMEYYWFESQIKSNKKFDIAILGINTSLLYDRLDSYDEFLNDYYSMYRWVARLSLEMPSIKIVLIHHASAGKDEIESEILFNSNVNVLEKNINSYEVAFSSTCAITYGSSMGYELNAHGLTTFFIDPGDRCSFMPDKGTSCIDEFKIDKYEELLELGNQIINGNQIKKPLNKDFEKICMYSANTSNRMFELFGNLSE